MNRASDQEPTKGLPAEVLAAPQTSDSQVVPERFFSPPAVGTFITSQATGNSYQIGPELGQGSFGIVFDCTDTWGNELAAKVFKPRNLPFEVVQEHAAAEFIKLMQLRHPNITYVFDAFEFRDTFYIVFERCHWPLHKLLAMKDYNGMVWIKSVARCVLQAVHFIHVSGYAHQDIHLGNVFLQWVKDELLPEKSDQALTFKIGDLGLTKLLPDMDAQNTVLADWIRAPEAIDPSEYGTLDHRMDIYHCGLLFLQVLVGRELRFTREQILDGSPRRMALKLPAPYSFALEKALRRHVEFRTASAIEFWRDLHTPAENQVPLAPQSTPITTATGSH